MLADEGIREVLGDPEMMEEVRQRIGGNGFRPMTTEGEPSTVLPAEGTLRRKVFETACALSGKFEARDIIQRLQTSGYEFTAKDPMVAVNNVLNFLEDRSLVRQVRKGTGRQPSIFEVTYKEATKK